ncbi:hypothetical protein [Noviherbaspirillum cavernae]|uniref:hypothetical protein n=1 Tax=Noviherbaspirillum cavernae TaxID=2320862 RepID=UPI0011C3EC1B|nr:hypothetical protein [Noviherbaspirillum cavernae]
MLKRPEGMIPAAGAKFDEQGRLVDGKTREFIQQLLVSLADWTRHLKNSDAKSAASWRECDAALHYEWTT